MSEHPIIFNGEMVRAILDGRKTQTRRVVKEPYQSRLEKMLDNGNTFVDAAGSGPVDQFCPYGVPGDTLWVREAFWHNDPFHAGELMDVLYCATDEDPRPDLNPLNDWIKKPSIHMPRWASRISLAVKNVRAERVQEISAHAVELEGVNVVDNLPHPMSLCREVDVDKMILGCAQSLFKDLWDSINGKRGYGWDVNPWVWIVEFEPNG